MLNKKVKEIMTTDVITTTSDIDVVYAFEKLMEYKISSLPVVEDDKLIGIITATDVGHNLNLDKYELFLHQRIKEAFGEEVDRTIQIERKQFGDKVVEALVVPHFDGVVEYHSEN